MLTPKATIVATTPLESHNTRQIKEHLVKRLLHACIREELLPHTIKKNLLIIPLKSSKKTIIVNKVQRFELKKYKLEGEVVLLAQGRSPIIIEDAHILLNLIHDELKEKIELSQWKIFVAEISNCDKNNLLASQFMRNFNYKLANVIANSTCKTFPEFLASQYSATEQLLFFEVWAAKGHPYHPCHKTKLGFGTKAYMNFSPEFNQDINLPLAAIEKSIVHVESEQNHFDYNEWFAEHYSTSWLAWLEKLAANGLSKTAYYPIFIHPWQYENVSTKLFSDAIEKKQLILFKDIFITTKASLSFRTLIEKDNPHQPHIKLPLAVRSTSAMRTISPASVQNGPKIGKILRQILAVENNFDNTLKIAYEGCGLHIKHSDPDIAKHLGIIYRENPSRFLKSNQMPIVVAALFEESPLNQLPLFIEMLQGATVSQAMDYFDHYCKLVIRAYLDLFLIYGIALEGHQQNTIAVFENYQPQFMIARDLGGVRIHLPTLQAQGFTLNAYPNSATITDDPQEATNKFLHTVIQYHLGEIILLLVQHYKIIESNLWKIVRRHLLTRFQELKATVDPARWQQEYSAIFENDWQMKSLMRMRLHDVYSKYIYLNLENPLRETKKNAVGA